jgi:uncharacterized damage-inducible protein DinB
MRESARLADLLEQAYAGEEGRAEAWHGPSLRALLSGVSAEQALRRPVASGHSIWELVLHIAVWDEICSRRLRGERILATTGSPEDWPALEGTDEAAWQASLARLARAQQELVATVRSLSEERLQECVAGWPWTCYLTIHGTLHHDLYHAGQIALLRRGLDVASGPPP